MPAFFLPSEYPRVRMVDSFQDLLASPFENGVNAFCWQRDFSGDFSGVLEKLNLQGGITTLDEDWLENETWSRECRQAVDSMLADLKLLRSQNLFPELNGIAGYERDEDTGLLRTDVYSFHADSATDQADTWLCTYHGAPSEGLKNEDALRRVDDPGTRQSLLKDYGGPDDPGFLEYLAHHCYDLHYASRPDSQPFSFGKWNLWRIALNYPGCPVPPCIHRAPESLPNSQPRLMLIA